MSSEKASKLTKEIVLPDASGRQTLTAWCIGELLLQLFSKKVSKFDGEVWGK